LFQLAAGGFFDDIMIPITDMFGGAKSDESSVQQQFDDVFQSVNENFSSQIDSWLDRIDFGSSNDACANNLTQQYYSIGNATRK
jgi:hypothetical protein